MLIFDITNNDFTYVKVALVCFYPWLHSHRSIAVFIDPISYICYTVSHSLKWGEAGICFFKKIVLVLDSALDQQVLFNYWILHLRQFWSVVYQENQAPIPKIVRWLLHHFLCFVKFHEKLPTIINNINNWGEAHIVSYLFHNLNIFRSVDVGPIFTFCIWY